MKQRAGQAAHLHRNQVPVTWRGSANENMYYHILQRTHAVRRSELRGYRLVTLRVQGPWPKALGPVFA